MQCHCCGMTFRSMSAEAKHRHNFPAYCRKTSKRWAAFQRELAADKEQTETKESQHGKD